MAVKVNIGENNRVRKFRTDRKVISSANTVAAR